MAVIILLTYKIISRVIWYNFYVPRKTPVKDLVNMDFINSTLRPNGYKNLYTIYTSGQCQLMFRLIQIQHKILYLCTENTLGSNAESYFKPDLS